MGNAEQVYVTFYTVRLAKSILPYTLVKVSILTVLGAKLFAYRVYLLVFNAYCSASNTYWILNVIVLTVHYSTVKLTHS